MEPKELQGKANSELKEIQTMDNTETYIKMIYEGWDDLEELWQPRRTDIVARYGTFEQVLSDFRAGQTEHEPMVIDIVEDDGQIRLFVWQTYFKDKHKLVALLSQDQLQEMLEYPNTTYLTHMFSEWQKWCYLPDDGTSMEQLWLAFVMKEKYNKTWNGDNWKEDKWTPLKLI